MKPLDEEVKSTEAKSALVIFPEFISRESKAEVAQLQACG